MSLAPRNPLTAPRLHHSIHDHSPTHTHTNMPAFAISAAVPSLSHLALFRLLFCTGHTHHTRVACDYERRICSAQRAASPARELAR